MKQRRFALVYQAGIANLFEVDSFNLNEFGRNAKLILQSSFLRTYSMAEGIKLSGHLIHTCACNMAGDIKDAQWTDDLESQPFFENMLNVEQRKVLE